MSWLDDLFGGSTDNSAPDASAAPTAPPATPAAPADPSAASHVGGVSTSPGAPLLSYDDFARARTKAIKDWQYQHNGLLGHFGQGQEEAESYANATMPQKYQEYRIQHAQMQNSELGVGQKIGYMNSYRQDNGQAPVDPNNIPAGFMPTPSPTAAGGAPPAPPAAGGPMPPAPMGAPPAGNGAPSVNSPLPPMTPARPPIAPTAAPNAAPVPLVGAPTGNPADAQRLAYGRMAKAMAGLPDFLPQMLDATKLAQTGAMPGMIASPATGQLIDAASGNPVGDVNKYLAARAGQSAGAEANARLPAENAAAKFKAQTEAGLRFSDVQDAQGNKQPISDLDLARAQAAAAKAGVPPLTRGPGTVPERDTQIKEVSTAQANGDDAAKSQTEVQRLAQALQGVGNFKGPITNHPVVLNIAKQLAAFGLLNKDDGSKIGAAELANMDSNSIVSAMAKAAAAGRVPLGIYNQINARKPGLASGNPKLQLEALNQDFQRAQDYAAFAAHYYSQPGNLRKLDARTAFEKANPKEMYESRVLPLTRPADGQFKQGFTYLMKDGQSAVFNGKGFTRFKSVSEQ